MTFLLYLQLTLTVITKKTHSDKETRYFCSQPGCEHKLYQKLKMDERVFDKCKAARPPHVIKQIKNVDSSTPHAVFHNVLNNKEYIYI